MLQNPWVHKLMVVGSLGAAVLMRHRLGRHSESVRGQMYDECCREKGLMVPRDNTLTHVIVHHNAA